ncbi:MAG: nuclear transport factor 2 family protein [Candidatus Latescibacteria bacterium]|jgi:hypothetical protein|nr:nuclear transport factor 2 family protein [Candidatus Latescibacterota bacterium]
MTESDFREWLERYLRPQEKRSAEAIRNLFAEDGVYWWGPYSEPCRGVDAIYLHHRNALSRQEDIHYRYDILAVTERYGLARFYLKIKDLAPGEPNRYEGIFMVHLDDENRCTLFQEWYNATTVDGDQQPQA